MKTNSGKYTGASTALNAQRAFRHSFAPSSRWLRLQKAILTALIALPLAGFGGSVDDGKNALTPPSPVSPYALSGDLGVTVLNQYNERGLVLENRGIVFQPYGDLFLKVYEGKGLLSSFSLQAGLFSDVDPAAPIGHTDPKSWTEIYWQTGILTKIDTRLSISSVYRQFTSPSDAYAYGRNLNNIISFDDAGLIAKRFSLQPHLTVLYELPAPGHSGLAGHSWYFEPGIAPNYIFFSGSKTPVTVGVPLTFGLGGFFASSNFGYVSVGPQVSVPLSFLPPQYGVWRFSAGYRYYRLGDTTTAFAPQHETCQNIFNMSLGLKF